MQHSPCKNCELLDEDKNNPVCENCEKRIEYVSALGGMDSSVPVELADLAARREVEMQVDKQDPQDPPPTTSPDHKRLCEACGEKETIHPNSKLCASCMAKKSHRGKKPHDAVGAGKIENPSTDKDKLLIAPQGTSGGIVIEFKNHIQILKEVEKLAEQEMRPLDCQILYMLKKYMDAKEGYHGQNETESERGSACSQRAF